MKYSLAEAPSFGAGRRPPPFESRWNGCVEHSSIRVLIAAAPPACVRPFIDAVASTDREYVELPGGHISLIAGRGASVHCWPKVASWLTQRS